MRKSTKNKIMKNSAIIAVFIAIGIGAFFYYNQPLSVYPGSYSESCHSVGNCLETCNTYWKEINSNQGDCDNNRQNFVRDNPLGSVSSCYSCDGSYYCADYSNVITRSIAGCSVTTTTLPQATTTTTHTTTTTLPLPPQQTDYTLAILLMLGIAGTVGILVWRKKKKR